MASKKELKHGPEVGERIRAYRLLKSMTQQDLADLVSVNRAYLAEIERGVKEPSYNFLMKLFTSTSLSSNWLLTGEGSMFLTSSDRVASESPEDEESSLAVSALREDILAQKIVLMLREVDEEDRREILAYAEKAKQAAEERARLVAAEAKIAELERHMGKAVG